MCFNALTCFVPFNGSFIQAKYRYIYLQIGTWLKNAHDYYAVNCVNNTLFCMHCVVCRCRKILQIDSKWSQARYLWTQWGFKRSGKCICLICFCTHTELIHVVIVLKVCVIRSRRYSVRVSLCGSVCTFNTCLFCFYSR